MSESNDLLISIVLMAYNQEAYIKAALDGVFSQTYGNLEIVISDDCSTDKTWEIILEEVKLFQSRDDLVRTIILNQTPRNLGVAKHFEMILSRCHGDVVVCQAGDDVSLPHRVSVIAEVARKNKRATVFCHTGICIDSNGNQINGMIERTSAFRPLGALMAYSRRVFLEFAPIVEKDAWEDCVYARRAQMIGDEVQINQPLLLRRVASGGISSGVGNPRSRGIRIAQGCLAASRQSRKDLIGCKGKISEKHYVQMCSIINEYERYYLDLYEMFAGRNIFQRFKAFCRFYSGTYLINYLKSFVVVFFPWCVCFFVRQKRQLKGLILGMYRVEGKMNKNYGKKHRSF